MVGYRRKPRRGSVRREVWGGMIQDRNRRKDKKKAKVSAKKQGEIGEALGDMRGIERRGGKRKRICTAHCTSRKR